MKIDRRSALARSPALVSAGAMPVTRGGRSDQEPPVGGFGPTPERGQHGQEFRPGNVISHEGRPGRAFRVASSLYQLRKADKIDDAQERAAERWYRDYVCSEGASDPGAGASCGRADLHEVMIIRAESSARRTEVRKALGFCAEVRLRMLMVDCLSFTAMGEVLKLGRQEVSSQAAFLLKMLAEFYETRDRRRRPTGPP